MSQDSSLQADVLTEFMEVALHSILYVRNLYPKQIFSLKKKYQIPIHVSKHPKVNEYLNGCLKTIKHLIELDALKDVCVVVMRDEEIMEKYVFSVKLNQGTTTDEYLVPVEELFRQFILKLTVMESRLRDLPEDCTFAVHVVTNEQCYVRLNESVHFESSHSDFPWIEVDKPQQSNSVHRILPVKSAECSLFALNVYVEN